MQYTLALLAGFAAVALAAPQGITSIITPTGAAPAGCTGDSGLFEISISTLSSKKAKRASTLEASLSNGVLTDENGKRGYIASNYQLQFDYPVQNGAIYTGGFSLCANDTLALGSSAIWYECLSGTFYNIYSEDWAAQCQAAFLDTIPISSTISATTAVVTTTADGQAGASTAVTTAVSAVTSSAAIVSSISDYQIQGATTTTAVTSSVEVVSSIVATTSSAAVISQITDNQPQAPTTTTAVTSSYLAVTSVTVKTSTTSVAIVSQISDHQIQAPTATSASVTAYTGAASLPTMAAQLVLAAAGAAAMML